MANIISENLKVRVKSESDLIRLKEIGNLLGYANKYDYDFQYSFDMGIYFWADGEITATYIMKTDYFGLIDSCKEVTLSELEQIIKQ